jgi:hypothetical protein
LTTTCRVVDDYLSSVDDYLSSVDDYLSSGDDYLSSGDDYLSSGDDYLSSGDDYLSSGDDYPACWRQRPYVRGTLPTGLMPGGGSLWRVSRGTRAVALPPHS